MTSADLIQQLRSKPLGLFGEYLPDEIRYFDRNGNQVVKPLLDATLDEIAFAAQTLKAERAALSCRQQALEDMYALARKQGFLGADSIGRIVGEVTK